jgi:hypothetical protein
LFSATRRCSCWTKETSKWTSAWSIGKESLHPGRLVGWPLVKNNHNIWVDHLDISRL